MLHGQPPASFYSLRIATAFGLMLAITLIGTAGFMLIEGHSLLDAFYMTVITLSTVGFGDIVPQTQGGKVFTIFLIISSLGVVGYAVSSLARFFLEGELNRIIRGRRMDKRIADMKDHIILCGGGRTGYAVAEEFKHTVTPFTVIEQDPEAIEEMRQHLGDIVHLQADATEDETLRVAGIDRAKGLISVLGEDKDNVFVVLSARSLNPKLRIVARLIEEENEQKLRTAGANEIVSPDAIGGMRLASTMIRPAVVTFLDTMFRMKGALRMEELPITRQSDLADKTLAECDIIRRTGVLVVAVKPEEGAYRFNPGADARIETGDTLIVLGTQDQLGKLGI